MKTISKSGIDRDDVDQAYDALVENLYIKHDNEIALESSKRLRELLNAGKVKPKSIFSDECWSLVNEADGEFDRAIKYRVSEINKIHRADAASRGTPSESYTIWQHGYDDLRDRYEILAILYHDNGDTTRAISVLQKCKRLCLMHKIHFDNDLLREYSEENSAVDRRMKIIDLDNDYIESDRLSHPQIIHDSFGEIFSLTDWSPHRENDE